jgi:RimJ/RimL family protein N-acetyltransferase
MNIHGKRIMLRAIERSDLDTLHLWANDPEIWNFLGGWHFPYSRASMDKWFESLQNDTLNQRFAIEVPKTGLIGTANLTSIDWKNNHAEHGLMIADRKSQGKGYGCDTVMAMMRHVFEQLHYERLDANVVEYNERSYNLFCKKCGWIEEGRQKNWFFRNNRYWDRIWVGVTREGYESFVKKSRYWAK